MKPGGKGSFQSVNLQRPGRTGVCSHSAKDMAARVALIPILIIAVLRPSACALVNSRNGRTKTNARKAMSLAAICAPALKLARVQAYKLRCLILDALRALKLCLDILKNPFGLRAVQRDPFHKLFLFL